MSKDPQDKTRRAKIREKHERGKLEPVIPSRKTVAPRVAEFMGGLLHSNVKLKECTAIFRNKIDAAAT